jgi:hypothetical protein
MEGLRGFLMLITPGAWILRILGPRGGLLPFNVAPRSHEAFRRRSREGAFCKVPGAPIRVGAVDVLREQVVRDLQAPHAQSVPDRSLVARGRLCSSISLNF